MPPEKNRARGWKVGAGYAAFGVLAFLLFLYLTFPYDAFRDRLVAEADRFGWDVRVGSLGPGLMGITARNVRIEKDAAAAPPPTPGQPVAEPASLLLPRARFGPSFVPLGMAFEAQAFGGELTGAFGGVGNGSIQLEADGLDAQRGDLKALTGVDLDGALDGKLMLTIPLAQDAQVRDYDLSQSDGTLQVTVTGLTIKGGSLVVPMYGQPTPFDLPRIEAGDLRGEIRFEKGLGTLALQGSGPDVELRASGTVKLHRRPQYSELNLDVKLKAQPDFVKRLGIVGSGLSMLPADREDPSFRVAKITGMLGNPRFSPGQR